MVPVDIGCTPTPPAVASRLAAAAVKGRHLRSACDPAAGDLRLLRAVLDAIATGSSSPRLWAADARREVARAGVPASSVRADTLALGLRAWPDAPPDGFDLVIGNPPFRSPLLSAASHPAQERAFLRAKYGDVAATYADTASMFLVAACEMAAPTGRVAMIMPLSFLAARDAGPARRKVLELASLEGLWVAPESVFPDADVRVCAVILDRSGARRRPVRRWVGDGFDPLPAIEVDSDRLRDEPTWGHLAAAALGIPEVDLTTDGRIGDLGRATAGFRDQFYGLVPHLRDAATAPSPGGDTAPDATVPGQPTSPDGDTAPLVTVGLVDPGSVAWGVRPTTVARTRYRGPTVDLATLAADDPSLGRWVAERRTPKLVVATQTRVIEAAPDPAGAWIPSTPLIALHPHTGADALDLWRMLAALLAPPLSVHALARYAGAAMSARALKLSARQVQDLPLPADRRRLDRAARRLAAAHAEHGTIPLEVVREVAPLTTAAYGCGAEITRWWADRLPPARSAPGGAAPR